jgi:hypothetical protein
MVTYWVGDELIRKNKRKRRKQNRSLKRTHSDGSAHSGTGLEEAEAKMMESHRFGETQGIGDTSTHSQSDREVYSTGDTFPMDKTIEMVKDDHYSFEMVKDDHYSKSETFPHELESTAVTEESGMSDKSDRGGSEVVIEQFHNEDGIHATSSKYTSNEKNGHGDESVEDNFARSGPLKRYQPTRTANSERVYQ